MRGRRYLGVQIEDPFAAIRQFPSSPLLELSWQHKIDCDSGLKRHGAAVLHMGFETPLGDPIGCGGCQHRVAANHSKLLHVAFLAHLGFQDDRALNVLLLCRRWIFRFNPLE